MHCASRIGLTCVENITVVGAVATAENVTGARTTPGALAVTVLAPAIVPTVSVACAWPIASVMTFVADKLPPPLVTSNTTVTKGTGSWFASLTIATNGNASAVPRSALCSLPDTISSVGPGTSPGVTSTVAVQPPSTMPSNPIENTERIQAA